MPILSEEQIKEPYFNVIGGFRGEKKLHELSEYQGGERACIACTQLPSGSIMSFSDVRYYSEREKRKILKEWIEFLTANPKTFRVLHFNSHVPQTLFNAACCQENLEELRFKWGGYRDISALEKLPKLQYLYLGQCAGVTSIEPLTRLKNLVVLHVVGFKRIEDYSSLVALDKLEQLVISGPTLQRTPVKDLEFLRQMPNLRSIWIPNVRLLKKYTAEELADLKAAVPNLHDINGCIFGKSHPQRHA